MNKGAKRTVVRRKQSGGKRSGSDCTALVPLDTAAVRAGHLALCRELAAAFARDEVALRTFRTHDEEGFRTWMLTLHPELRSELRNLQEQLQYEEAIYREAVAVQEEQATSRRASYRQAMQNLERGHTGRKLLDDETASAHRNRRFDGDKEPLDDDADGLDEMGRLFAEMLGVEAPAKVEKAKLNCRDCYRRLCKLLHPDAATAVPEGVMALWHEAQDAYARKDQAWLCELLARAELASGAYTRFDTIAELVVFEDRMADAIDSVRIEIEQAKRNPAWKFHLWKEAKKKQFSTALKKELLAHLHLLKASIGEFVRVRTRCTREPRQRRHGQPMDAWQRSWDNQ